MADVRLPDGETVATTVQMAPGRTDLGVRVVSAVVMAALAGAAFVAGGWFWRGFIAIITLATYVEFVLLVRGTRIAGLRFAAALLAGACYIGLGAAALAGVPHALALVSV